MKVRNVWIVLFLAIVSLLVFQIIWLYNTYNIKSADLEKTINTLLTESINNEVELRYNKHLANEDIIFISDPETGDKLESKKHTSISNAEIMEAGLFQHILELGGFPTNLITLDSIFQSELKNADIPLGYSLSYKDSTGTIIEQIGNLPQSKVNKAFHSEALLIVDGKRVQAIVNITPYTVFKQMFGLLAASLMMLVIMIFCIFYQTKTIFNEYRMNRLRQDFSNALTHDMKTPLGTINTVLANFRSGALDNKSEKREKFGKTAMNQVDNLLLLVEKILTIAKIEDGKYTISHTNTDMSVMIQELKERFSISNEKRISIQTSVDIDENEEIYVDTTLIKDAISNLIDNAIKYSGDAVNIKITCSTTTKGLHISVDDNGFGISEKNQRIIFDKFERGAATGKKGAKGFGLGLNFVKRVTEAHGGLVTLFSDEGKGSQFSLILPLRKFESDNI